MIGRSAIAATRRNADRACPERGPRSFARARYADVTESECDMTVAAMLRHPSAFLPIVMSLVALAMVAWFVTAHGVVRQPDESAQARVWQVLMALQVPVIAYFALRWIPRETRPARIVLTLQVIAAMVAAAPVLLLGF